MSPIKIKDYLVNQLGCKHLYASSTNHQWIYELDGMTILAAFTRENTGDLRVTHVHISKQIDTFELEINEAQPIEPQLNRLILTALFQ